MINKSSQSNDVSGFLSRLHDLGSATEEIFNRLYNTLNGRRRRDAALNAIQSEARRIAARNRRLRELIAEREIEVERLEAIFASISEGIIMQDQDGRVIMMNAAAQNLLGNQRNFWRSELGLLFAQQKDEAIGTELAPLSEARRVTIGNRLISAQIAGVADSQNERIGTLMILRDITGEDLGERLKNSFVTHISHELITPLAPLRMASEVLLSSDPDAAPNRRMLEMIGRNVDLLDRMITEMLELSAMTSGDFRVQRKPLALEPLIWDVADTYREDVLAADLDLTIMLRDASDLRIEGDSKQLHWALGNLLRNAVQYNEPGQHISVAGWRSRQGIEITFSDTGVGIAEDDLPHIFDLFYRGTPTTRAGKRLDPRGLGQGLFIARTIVEAHGGSIHVQSRQHQGTKFQIILPVSAASARPATLPG